MKKTLLAILLLFSSLAYGQDLDKLMVNKQVDCSDVSYNCGLYFIKYVQEEKLDSAQNIIDYWEGKCGEREPIFRAKILLALKERNYSDSLLKEGVMNNLYNYRNRIEVIKYSNYYAYDEYKPYYGFTPPGQEFDKMTQEIAKSLINEYNSGTTEYLFAEFYSGEVDTVFSRLQSGSSEGSFLVDEYNKEVEKYAKQGEFHMAWITGMWIPTGDLTKLGLHPDLGFQIGSKVGKMNYDFTMMFKFINAANYYTAYRGSTPELTNNFFGGYIGFDLGRDVYVRNGHEIQLTGGIALDGFDVLEGDDELDIDSESILTYNFNFGLGYRYYITNSLYLGLKAKYNIVDYSLNGVTDFKGNPITVQITIGNVNNAFRNRNLKALGYKLRK
ncbi:MAG: hypothetical protein R2757_18390 [Draconibacterium sp.]